MAVLNNTVTRDELVVSHLGMVSPMARLISRRLPPSFEVADLESEGQIGLMRAASTFRSDRGIPFVVYARYFVRGAILDSVRRRHWTENTCRPLADAPERYSTSAVQDEIDQRRLIEAVFTYAARLPRHQQVVLSQIRAGWTLQQIATNMGVGESTVFYYREAAIAALRALIAEDGGAHGRLTGVPSKPSKPASLAAATKAALADPAAVAIANSVERRLREQAEVDELGALEKEFAPLRPKLARIELLREAVRSRYQEEAADKTFEATGQRFTVMVGARANVSVIDYAKLIKAIGAKMFSQIAKTTLKALEENVACGVRAECVRVEQIGARSLKTFERGTPEIPKAA